MIITILITLIIILISIIISDIQLRKIDDKLIKIQQELIELLEKQIYDNQQTHKTTLKKPHTKRKTSPTRL